MPGPRALQCPDPPPDSGLRRPANRRILWTGAEIVYNRGALPPMTKALIKKEQDAFVKAVTKALKEAAKEARRQAKIHGTKVWVTIDGKIVGLKP